MSSVLHAERWARPKSEVEKDIAQQETAGPQSTPEVKTQAFSEPLI